MKLSFVIPCYGSEKTIEFVTDEIVSKVAEREGFDYEIIAVNDCSPDAVWEKLLRLHKRNSKIKLIHLAKNMNRPGAVMAGMNHADGDIVIIMDDDGQCPMDRLWDLLEPLDNGFDVSMATYAERKQSLFKDFGTWVNKRMTEFVLKKPRDLQFTNFMAIRRPIINELVKYHNPYPYLTGLLLRTTQYITNVPMEQRSRYTGKSTFTLLKMISLWLNGLTAFSVIPLRISSILGALFAIAGLLYAVVIILQKIFNPAMQAGYSSIIVAMMIIGGIIMLICGMIGEYIGRIYICMNKSPQYVLREKIGFEESERTEL